AVTSRDALKTYLVVVADRRARPARVLRRRGAVDRGWFDQRRGGREGDRGEGAARGGDDRGGEGRGSGPSAPHGAGGGAGRRLSQPPPAPSAEQARVARRLVGLFNDFDLEAAREVLVEPTPGQEEWIQWLRQRVGACQPGEPMVVRGER